MTRVRSLCILLTALFGIAALGADWEITSADEIARLEDLVLSAKEAGDPPDPVWHARLIELYGAVDRNGLDEGGDLCADAPEIPGVPVTLTGSTFWAYNNYDAVCPYNNSSAKDVVYRYTPTEAQTLTLSLCRSSYDTKLYVYRDQCSGVPYACNDDSNPLPCPGSPSRTRSYLECVLFEPGHTYYIVVDGYYIYAGPYTLDITYCCGSITCPPGARRENEPMFYDGYVDRTNGGCLSNPPAYTQITCGDVICGTSGSYGASNFDWDWYALTLTEQDSVIWQATAEFPVEISIVSGACPGVTVVSATAAACQLVSVAACLDAGTYYLVIRPSTFVGVSTGADYVASVDCRPCEGPQPPSFTCECQFAPHTYCSLEQRAVSRSQEIEIPIEVPEQYHITDVNVCLDVRHPVSAQLLVKLISPSGTEVILNQPRAGSGSDFLCTVFDDEAAVAISQGAAPYFGSFRPDGNLFDFDGENAVGTWKLQIATSESSAGVVLGVCLVFEFDYILPVELLGFEAVPTAEGITLNWSTASEMENDRFIIQRDGVDLAEVGTLGNTATGHQYSYSDHTVLGGMTYVYSLSSIDVSGQRYELASRTVVAGMNTRSAVSNFALHQNYPNPFNPTTEIAYDLPESGYVRLSVFDVLGREIAQLVDEEQPAGRHAITFDATALPSGLYLYRIDSGQFSQMRKMVLMK